LSRIDASITQMARAFNMRAERLGAVPKSYCSPLKREIPSFRIVFAREARHAVAASLFALTCILPVTKETNNLLFLEANVQTHLDRFSSVGRRHMQPYAEYIRPSAATGIGVR
jgi:hypothetical protein